MEEDHWTLDSPALACQGLVPLRFAQPSGVSREGRDMDPSFHVNLHRL